MIEDNKRSQKKSPKRSQKNDAKTVVVETETAVPDSKEARAARIMLIVSTIVCVVYWLFGTLGTIVVALGYAIVVASGGTAPKEQILGPQTVGVLVLAALIVVTPFIGWNFYYSKRYRIAMLFGSMPVFMYLASEFIGCVRILHSK